MKKNSHIIFQKLAYDRTTNCLSQVALTDSRNEDASITEVPEGSAGDGGYSALQSAGT